MLTAFARAFKTPDLRKKILFTLMIMALFRVGSLVPTPGVDYADVQQCLAGASSTSGVLGMMNLFSGGALLHLSIFALGIMPYITASIIVQLLTVVIPRFEALKEEGQSGQTKLTQYTRYLTIGLAILQSATYVTFARNPQQLFGGQCTSIMPDESWTALLIMVITMTAGTGLVMWMGELITDRGVGNGMSLLIFTSIVAGFPTAMWSGVAANGRQMGRFAMVMALGILIVAAVVFVEQSQRRVPVQYAKRLVGRQVYGGSSTYIPLKINMANVIPVIFASSLLQLPMMVAQFQQGRAKDGSIPGWAEWIMTHLGRGSGLWYGVIFFVLIVFFTFFYVSITFNPKEVSDNMKRYGGFIPGIRAGRPTEQYLDYILTRLTVVGALYLGMLSLIPILALEGMGDGVAQNFPFGGTSLLIMVGVGLETVKQIEAQLEQRNYEGFLR
ncbi:preprotein translocase subunit SecY [Arsenicicoccus dermatophilus]|uniref:preprotein translocase subunit SecY n=1 Tax=Arsenicicoccus dermatophilus TaxID=1076331 RepID=UPI001F4CC977|nr:preprotein translocase subunit SecY [Arsenicicoccus dermatophilus]